MLYPRQEYYIMSPETELTPEKLGEWLRRHKQDCARMQYLKDMYEGRHPIQLQPKKEPWKPDNRIVSTMPSISLTGSTAFSWAFR